MAIYFFDRTAATLTQFSERLSDLRTTSTYIFRPVNPTVSRYEMNRSRCCWIREKDLEIKDRSERKKQQAASILSTKFFDMHMSNRQIDRQTDDRQTDNRQAGRQAGRQTFI